MNKNLLHHEWMLFIRWMKNDVFGEKMNEEMKFSKNKHKNLDMLFWFIIKNAD